MGMASSGPRQKGMLSNLSRGGGNIVRKASPVGPGKELSGVTEASGMGRKNRG